MKTNQILVGLAGILVFLSIALTFIWILPAGKSSDTKELTLDEATSKIKNKEVSEVTIRQNEVVLINKNKEKFSAKIDESDEPREAILREIDKINEEKPGSLKLNLEQSSNSSLPSMGWFVLLNSLPFYLMWAATLAVIVYAVRTLSRNKG